MRARAAVTVTTAGLVAVAGGIATAGQQPAATTGWVATATQALQPNGATSLGAAPASTPLRVTLGLAPRNPRGLDALIAAGRTLTPAQYLASYAPTAGQAQQVADYLRAQGFQGVQIAANRLQVNASGTAAQATSAFATSLGLFRVAGVNRIANTVAASVPSSLSGIVTGVLGLNSFPAALPHASLALPNLSGFSPKQFQQVYDAGGTPTGAATSIAIIAEGDLTGTLADLRTAEAANGLPQVPVTVVRTGPASTDTSGADEWDLDTQTSTAVAQTVQQLYLYDAPSLDDADLAAAVNAFAAQDVARAGSASLGECDLLARQDGFTTVADAAFQQAAAQGQTFFASSGDTGSACPIIGGTNGIPGAGLPDTSYPASSTYVTGVGGTTLLADSSGNYQSEIAWYAGGGGISPLEAPGAWTARANPVSRVLGAAGVGRGVPDVAADADATTGALVYVDGAVQQIGGTSLSSPLFLGGWARLESAHGNALGFAPPRLYALYDAANPTALSRNAVPGFHDVVLGVDGAYAALPGYDLTTGLGTPDLTALSKAL